MDRDGNNGEEHEDYVEREEAPYAPSDEHDESKEYLASADPRQECSGEVGLREHDALIDVSEKKFGHQTVPNPDRANSDACHGVNP